jgi:hypothetical protein
MMERHILNLAVPYLENVKEGWYTYTLLRFYLIIEQVCYIIILNKVERIFKRYFWHRTNSYSSW